MKILLVASYFPFPLYSGGQVRLFNLLKNLGKKHQITLICEVRKTPEEKDFSLFKKYCQNIYTVIRPKQWTLNNILKTGFSFLPFLLVGHKNREMTEIISRELKKDQYDLVHVETFYVMHNLPKDILIPVVLTEHNVEWKIYKNWVDGFWGILARPLLYLDVLKMKFWEQHFWQKADKVVAVSDVDQKEIAKEINKKVELVPNGVDCDYFSEVEKKEPKNPTIVFVGSFKWLQNRDAVFYLLKKVWPKIKEKVANVQLLIIGNKALKYFDKSQDRVRVGEGVIDIRKVYSESTVLMAPIRIGGGTKFKILESMASGLPIVTTPKGVEGLGHDTNGIMVGNSENELADYCIELLNDKVKRENSSAKEKEFVRINFDWKDISLKLERVYENCH